MTPASATGDVGIVLADDHRLFREGLAAILQTDPSLHVAGQAGTGPDAIDAVTRLEPDLVLLDVEMPGSNVRSTIRTLRRRAPDTRIIVLTMHEDAALRRDLLAHGASGYLTKNTASRDLLTAIRSYARDGTDPDTPHGTEPGAGPGPVSDDTTAIPLTDRETTVLSLMARGRSNAQIAMELCITTGTTRRHVHTIYKKLNATSRIDAVIRSRRFGLLEHDPR